MSFYFYDAPEYLDPLHFISKRDTIVPQKLDLAEAVAAFQVESIVEVVVDCGREEDCKAFEPFVDAVGSLKQWALASKMKTKMLDYQEDSSSSVDDSEDEDEEGSRKSETIDEDESANKDEAHHDEGRKTHNRNEKKSDKGGKSALDYISSDVEEGSKRGKELEAGITDNDGGNDDSDNDGSDDDDEDDDVKDDDDSRGDLRHVWTFTLKPATPSTQGQIPVWPKAYTASASDSTDRDWAF